MLQAKDELFNRETVKAGKYRYSLPYWTTSHLVSVVETADCKLQVDFGNGMVTVPTEKIPENAIFEKM